MQTMLKNLMLQLAAAAGSIISTFRKPRLRPEIPCVTDHRRMHQEQIPNPEEILRSAVVDSHDRVENEPRRAVLNVTNDGVRAFQEVPRELSDEEFQSEVKASREISNLPPPTLGSLLDRIQEVFEHVTRQACGGSFTRKELRVGLRKLGPYIPLHLSVAPAAARVSITEGIHWSSLIFVHYGGSKSNTEHLFYPEFVYAQRVGKLPWHVQQLSGVFYECGLAYHLTTGSLKGKLYWIGFYVAVDPSNGMVTACHELRFDEIDVRGRGKYAQGKYVNKRWGISRFANDTWGSDDHERNVHLARIFSGAFSFWQQKEFMWTVSFIKDEKRATYCVQPTQAKTFFKDRDKTALTPTGKRKPIIHMVTEHPRRLDSGAVVTVKEHIRGLRRFDWKGYACAITAPKFHRLTSHGFDLAPDYEEDLPADEHGLIGVDQMGELLAKMEDTQSVQLPGRALH